MPTTLSCPSCHQEIVLPTGPVSRFACPKCQAEVSIQIAAKPPMSGAEGIPPVRQPAAGGSSGAEVPGAVASSAPAQVRIPSNLRKRDNRPGMLGQMVGVVGGGVLGLVMGYWLLNYFGGPRFNFLEVGLPWVAHTQPDWVPPEDTAAAPEPRRHAPPTGNIPHPRRVDPRQRADASAGPGRSVPTVVEEEPDVAAFEFPSYTSSELGQALATANAALGCENCQSTGFVKRIVVTGVTEVGGRRIEQKAERRLQCEVCMGKPLTRVNSDVYAKLRQLAQVVTFVRIDPSDPQLGHRREAVEQVLLKAAGNRERQDSLGRLAGFALQESGGDGTGVLLAGTVQDMGQQGELHWMRMVLFGRPEVVTVVSAGRAPLETQDRALIAGSVVIDPQQKLAGYEGSLPVVVLGGMHLRLPNESR